MHSLLLETTEHFDTGRVEIALYHAALSFKPLAVVEKRKASTPSQPMLGLVNNRTGQMVG